MPAYYCSSSCQFLHQWPYTHCNFKRSEKSKKGFGFLTTLNAVLNTTFIFSIPFHSFDLIWQGKFFSWHLTRWFFHNSLVFNCLFVQTKLFAHLHNALPETQCPISKTVRFLRAGDTVHHWYILLKMKLEPITFYFSSLLEHVHFFTPYNFITHDNPWAYTFIDFFLCSYLK